MNDNQVRKIIAAMFKTKQFVGDDYDQLAEMGPPVVPIILNEIEHRDSQMTICHVEHWNVLYTLMSIVFSHARSSEFSEQTAKLMLSNLFLKPDDTSIREMMLSTIARATSSKAVDTLRQVRAKLEVKGITYDYDDITQEVELDCIDEVIEDFEPY